VKEFPVLLGANGKLWATSLELTSNLYTVTNCPLRA